MGRNILNEIRYLGQFGQGERNKTFQPGALEKQNPKHFLPNFRKKKNKGIRFYLFYSLEVLASAIRHFRINDIHNGKEAKLS